MSLKKNDNKASNPNSKQTVCTHINPALRENESALLSFNPSMHQRQTPLGRHKAEFGWLCHSFQILTRCHSLSPWAVRNRTHNVAGAANVPLVTHHQHRLHLLGHPTGCRNHGNCIHIAYITHTVSPNPTATPNPHQHNPLTCYGAPCFLILLLCIHWGSYVFICLAVYMLVVVKTLIAVVWHTIQ